MAKQKENYFIYADPDKCLGCKSCELACGLAHAGTDIFTAVVEQLQIQPRNSVIQADDIVMPLQCRQCEDAPCALACPTGAVYQSDGMVKLNRDVCIGCKVCSMVCPFGAISIRTELKETGNRRSKNAKALKCDLCVNRTGEISEDTCACVEACPTKAIALVDYESYRMKLLEARGKEIAQAHTRKNLSRV